MKWVWRIVVALVIGCVVAFFLRRNPLKQVKKELEAIDSETATKLKVEQEGVEAARDEVIIKHHKSIEKFDEEQNKRMDALRDDPAALARWLTRVSS